MFTLYALRYAIIVPVVGIDTHKGHLYFAVRDDDDAANPNSIVRQIHGEAVNPNSLAVQAAGENGDIIMALGNQKQGNNSVSLFEPPGYPAPKDDTFPTNTIHPKDLYSSTDPRIEIFTGTETEINVIYNYINSMAEYIDAQILPYTLFPSSNTTHFNSNSVFSAFSTAVENAIGSIFGFTSPEYGLALISLIEAKSLDTDGSTTGTAETLNPGVEEDILQGNNWSPTDDPSHFGYKLVNNGTLQSLKGGRGDDILVGLGGDDILVGNGGNDTIYGGAENTTASAGDGQDIFLVQGTGLKDDLYNPNLSGAISVERGATNKNEQTVTTHLLDNHGVVSQTYESKIYSIEVVASSTQNIKNHVDWSGANTPSGLNLKDLPSSGIEIYRLDHKLNDNENWLTNGVQVADKSDPSGAVTYLNFGTFTATSYDDTFDLNLLIGRSFDGGGGTDTISYADLHQSISIDLADGSVSQNAITTSSLSPTPVITDFISNIENATASDKNDLLKGSDANNTLIGGYGSDTFTASKGNDTYVGGMPGTGEFRDIYQKDIDTLDYTFSGITHGLSISLAPWGYGTPTTFAWQINKGADGTDIVNHDIEIIKLTEYNDTISVSGFQGLSAATIDGGGGTNTITSDDSISGTRNDITQTLYSPGGYVQETLHLIGFQGLESVRSDYIIADWTRTYNVQTDATRVAGATTDYSDAGVSGDFSITSYAQEGIFGDAINWGLGDTIVGTNHGDNFNISDLHFVNIVSGKGDDVIFISTQTPEGIEPGVGYGPTFNYTYTGGTDTFSSDVKTFDTYDAHGDRTVSYASALNDSFNITMAAGITSDQVTYDSIPDGFGRSNVTIHIAGEGHGEITLNDLTGSFSISFADGSKLHKNENGTYSSTAPTITITTFTGHLADDNFVGVADRNEIFTGDGGNDVIHAGGGNDWLSGGEGNDTLAGDAGVDTLTGGDGADVFVVDTGDMIEDFNAKEGDLIRLADTNLYDKTFTTHLGVSDTVLYAGLPDVVLETTDGSFQLRLGAPTGYWGGGEFYIESPGHGTRTIAVDNDGNIISDEITGKTPGEDTPVLTDGNDTVNTLAGNDTLEGLKGDDTLQGGVGDDTYIFSNGDGHDVIIEEGGFDTIKFRSGVEASSVSYEKSGNDLIVHYGTGDDTITIKDFYVSPNSFVEQIVFADNSVHDLSHIFGETTKIEGTSGDDVLNGHDGPVWKPDYLFGYAGNDTLNGGDGADTMTGGTGNDTYIVNDVNDLVIEVSGEGVDSVTSSVSFVLGANIENLTLTGAAVGGTGNFLSNIITGNTGNNTLDGGAGADTLVGGMGNDTYVVDNLGDVVTENASEGTDTIVTSVSYTLGVNIENISLAGAAVITATGNEFNNILNGNNAASTLDGGAGNDTYIVQNSSTVVIEHLGEGTDSVQSSVSYTLSQNIENLTLTGTGNINGTGNILGNTLVGNAGNNTLDGGIGADTLEGGAGNDTYVVDDARDVLTELTGQGNDTVFAGTSYTLGANLENLILTGAGDNSGIGNSLANTMVGNAGANTLNAADGNDMLDGGAGADSLIGGSGDDHYFVDSGGDIIVENASEGVDTVDASISYTLSSNVENLVLTGTDAINGYGNSADNVVTGNSAANVLLGYEGNDTLDGGAGADTMIGGSGNDTYLVDNANDVISDDSGTDTVKASVSYVLGGSIENLVLTGSSNINATGDNGDNTITGNTGNNTLDGASGADTLDGGAGVDTMIGGAGDDVFFVSNADDVVVENVAEGTDSVFSNVSYALSANVESLTLTGSLAIDGAGNDDDNVIVGNSAVNTLSGHGGNDTLDGGTGYAADVLIGGAGDDLFIVHSPNAIVVENSDEGTDTVISYGSYTLGANVENLTLATGYAGVLVGNALDNTITGGVYGGTLDGGIGADTMIGGTGNDTYYVDNAGDVIVDDGLAVSQRDTVISSISYTLAGDLENLTLGGASTIDGIGNDADNTLIGNEATNILSGLAGNDTLDGGAGVDTLIGGGGNDVYIVDDAGDVVVENTDAGIDEVRSSVTYTLSSGVESLTLTGYEEVNGTGNEAANIITGNYQVNTLDGGAGDDTLDGGAGDDTYLGGAGDDVFIVADLGDVVIESASEGTDTVIASVDYTLADNVENLTLKNGYNISGTGNALDNVILGNGNVNTLDGGIGADTLIGGFGNDTYVIDNVGDVVIENANEGIDTVISAISHVLGANFENLILTGSADIDGTGNASSNTLAGNGGINTLTGGDGDDTYILNNEGDVVVENTGEGVDSIQSSVTHTLEANVENLVLTGTANIDGTGNNLDNTLIGNSGVNTLDARAGNDTLDGGAGADVMTGGTGNDVYIVDNIGDTVSENASEGIDTVEASISYTLGDNIENLVLNGSTDLTGTGNALDNTIAGNSGIDTLSAGLGDDHYFVNSTGTIIIENTGEGVDTVHATVDYTLGENLENLELVNGYTANATGNALDNILTGNDGSNTLDGGIGADTMIGGHGNDTYIVDNTGDVITELSDGATDSVVSGISYTLGDNLENLTLSGTDDHNGTGNGLDNSLLGNSGINILDAGAGNDTLDGGTGADTLIGGAGNDVYLISDASAVVVENSSEGTDTVRASVSYTLADNVENMQLTGTGNINATGNSLDNSIDGNGGDNTIIGGVGNDYLAGGSGNDTYVFHFGDGSDTISESAGTDKIVFGAGILPENLSFSSSGGNLTITYGDGDTIHIANFTASEFYRIETFEFADSTTVLTAADILSMTHVMIGTTGNDTLQAFDSNDTTFTGGAGDDTLTGGYGHDIYKFSEGDGHDKIFDYASTGDKIIFDSSIDPSTVAYTHGDNYDLTISYGTSGDTITVQNFLYPGISSYQVEGVEFADSTVHDVAYITQQAHILHGTSGNNNLSAFDDGDYTFIGGTGDDYTVGGNGNDTYLFSEGDGQDLISESSVVSTGDKILFDATVDPSSVHFVYSGGSLHIEYGTGDMITVSGYFTNPSQTVDLIAFSDPANTVFDHNAVNSIAHTMHGTVSGDNLYAFDNVNTTFIGGTGDDYMHGLGGNDVYKFATGDGHDTVYEGYGSPSDVIMFNASVDVSTVTYQHSGSSDLLIGYGAGGDTITVSNYFYGENNRVEAIIFDDAASTVQDFAYINHQVHILHGTSGVDNISSFDTEDTTFIGGTGNDNLNGWTGNDTYVFAAGDGNDTIREYPGNSTGDKIVFEAGIDPSAVVYSYNSSGDLIISYGSSDSVTVGSFFNSDDRYKIETVEFSDEAHTVLNIAAVTDLAFTWHGTSGNDSSYATLGAYHGTTFVGGTGNDSMGGSSGDDAYIFSAGDGHDTVYDYSGGTDTIKFDASVDPADVIFQRSASDLTIAYGEGDVITVRDYFSSDSNKIENVVFSDAEHTVYHGTDIDGIVHTLIGGTGSDYLHYFDENDITFIGGTGDDSLNGHYGDDTYIFADGDGHDTVSDYGSSDDKIVFAASVDPASVTYAHSGDNLVIHYGTGDDSVTISNFFSASDTNYRIESVQFSDVDNTMHDFSYISAQTHILHGTGGNDTLTAFDNVDTTLFGGTGDDVLNGRGGNDVYMLAQGDGHDTINDTWDSTADKIIFDASVSPDSVTAARSGSYDLVINYGTEGDSVTLSFFYYYYGPNYKIESVQFSDEANTVFSSSDLDALAHVLHGNSGNNSLYSADNSATTFIGGAGDDSLTDNYGGDSLYVFASGDGHDTIYDNNSISGDTIHFDASVDPAGVTFVHSSSDLVVHYGDGDTITVQSFFSDYPYYHIEGFTFSDEAATSYSYSDVVSFVHTLHGDSSNNTLSSFDTANTTFIGAAGDDTLNGGSGNDTYLFFAGDGHDVVNDGYYSYSSGDAIVFDGAIDPDTATFVKSADDLILGYGTGGDSITVQNYFNSMDKIENINFLHGGGTSFDYDDVVAQVHVMHGSSSPETLTAFDSLNTTMFGGAGDDTLNGNYGNDTLHGDAGADVLHGSVGADHFVFDLSTAFDAVDTISDFTASEGDVIDIHSLLTAYDPVTDTLADFVSISESGGSSYLSVDADGTGSGSNMVQIAVLSGVTGLADIDTLVTNGTLHIAA